MFTRRAYIDAARGYIDTPFHHAAREKGKGVDCMGLAACAAKEINYPFVDILTYSRKASGFALVERCAEFLDEIGVNARQPGDLGLFWIDEDTKLPQHAGIFTDYRDGLGLIHAWEQGGRRNTPRRRRGIGVSTDLGSVVEQDFTQFWRKRLIRVFRLRGIDLWQP